MKVLVWVSLMLGKNLLWVAKQHGHSVEVMLRMYAAWIEGATEADIQAIRNAMEARAKVSLLPFAQASPRDSACQIVLRPLASPDSASSPEEKKLRLEKARKKWRRGWDSNPRAGITRPSDFESAPL